MLMYTVYGPIRIRTKTAYTYTVYGRPSVYTAPALCCLWALLSWTAVWTVVGNHVTSAVFLHGLTHRTKHATLILDIFRLAFFLHTVSHITGDWTFQKKKLQC